MIVAIANQKGGVGKTTTAINLAAALARRGKRTLLIDRDPQANSTMSFLEMGEITKSVYDAIADATPLEEVIVPTGLENLSIAPARIALAKLEAKLVGEMDAHFRLKDQIAPIRREYPQIVIDCPPTLGLLTVNALVAATHLLIPIQSSYFALAASAGTPIGRLIPIDQIDPNPYQPRQVMGDLAELIASIAEKGILEPLVVRPRGERYQIVAGERRYQAATQVGLRELPVVIRDVDDT